MDIEKLKESLKPYLDDPVVLGGAGGVLFLIILLVIVRVAKAKAKGRVIDDTVGRARQKLRTDLRMFRDDLQRAIAACDPVFRKVDGKDVTDSHVGRQRTESKHRIQVRPPDLGTLKQMARTLGYDSTPVSQLEAHWRKVERQVLDYNSGRMDDSRTPIASVKQLEKELQSTVVLTNVCITAYSR